MNMQEHDLVEHDHQSSHQSSHQHEHEGLHSVHALDAASIKARIQDAEQQCLALGLKLTPLRAEVLELILSATKSVGAYDLMAQMKDIHRQVAPPTVYRSLDFLLTHGFIHRLASINAFIPCCHPRAGHNAVFLICQKCHHVSESSDATLLNNIQQLTDQAGFIANATSLEVSGLCAVCKE